MSCLTKRFVGFIFSFLCLYCSTSLRFNSTSTVSIDHSLDASDFNLDVSTNSSLADKSIADYCFDEKLCNVCNIINIDECKLDKAEMNYLLKFVLHRIRAWVSKIYLIYPCLPCYETFLMILVAKYNNTYYGRRRQTQLVDRFRVNMESKPTIF